VNCIEVLSAADARFVVASQEGLYLFEINMDQKLEQIVGPVGSGNVLSLDVLRNGKQLLTAGEDGYMRFYSTSDLSLIRTISIYSSLLAILSCLSSGLTCIYNLGGSATSVQVARFATDTLIYSVSSKVIEVWDLQRSTTQPVLYLETKINADQQFSHQPVFIWDICVHPDQPFICACVDSVVCFSFYVYLVIYF
jgi:WD40 repeat protein